MSCLKACFVFKNQNKLFLNSVFLFKPNLQTSATRFAHVASNTTTKLHDCNQLLRRYQRYDKILTVRSLSLSSIKFQNSAKEKEATANANEQSTTTAQVPVDSSSASVGSDDIDLRGFIIPEPPSVTPKVEVDDAFFSYSDLGLSIFSPRAWIFNSLQFFHEYLPWWGSIVVITGIVRLLMFPLFIYSMRNTSKMKEIMPQMQELQLKFNEAKRSGNTIELAKYGNKLMMLLDQHDIKPQSMLKYNIAVPLAQAFVFSSFFLTLRKMVAFPMESLKKGGTLWFEDLTIYDSTFLLPLLASGTLYIVVKLGVEFGTQTNPTNSIIPKLIPRVLPPAVFFITWLSGMQNAIMVYWVTSNAISIGQVLLLNQNSVRKFLKIPLIKKKETIFTKSTKDPGIFQSMKEGFQDMKASAIPDHRTAQRTIFEKAGIGPIKKTYKYDPTLVRPSSKK